MMGTVIVVTLISALVWSIVILLLATMGLKHPEHQSFLIQLAKSKKFELPNLYFGKSGKSNDKEGRHDNAYKE